jgi:hypothetical protein
VTRFSYTSVVKEVLVQLGLGDGAIIVAVNVLVDRFAKLGSVRLKEMGEMTSLSLWWDTSTGGSVSR